MKTEGDSKRKLSERKDPDVSAGCYIEQDFPHAAPAVTPCITRKLRTGKISADLAYFPAAWRGLITRFIAG